MMEIFSKIFGSKKVVDSTISAIDKMFYTNEEKAEMKMKYLQAIEPFKLALRFIAMAVTIPFVTMVMVAFTASFWVDITVQLQLLADTLGLPFTVIIGFYFMDGVGVFNGKSKKK